MNKQFIFILIALTIYTSATDDELSLNGIWVKWDGRKKGIPDHAVIGGEDKNGPIYVIRAEHYHNGESYRGVIPGRYTGKLNYATIPYFNKEHRVLNFEILTHSNYAWQDKNTDPSFLIPGGYDSFKNTIYVCRAERSGHWVPGKLHLNLCIIGDNGKEYEYSDWETLVRADNFTV